MVFASNWYGIVLKSDGYRIDRVSRGGGDTVCYSTMV
jgi:hypothetical protein